MKTEQFEDEVEQITSLFVNEFDKLNSEQLNWKPNPDTWSIAQILHHLIVINETYFPIPKKIAAGEYRLPWIAKSGLMVEWIGKMILNSVSPNKGRKIKTFPIWEPSKSNIDSDILHQFAVHQSQLKAFIKENRKYIENGTVICSPASRKIVYTFSKAIEIILNHERRHLEQAKILKTKLP